MRFRSTATLRGMLLSGALAVSGVSTAQDLPAECAGKARDISIAIAVTPPNVLHTPPYIAKSLGFFAKRCINADLVNFEGSGSISANTAVAQGTAIGTISEVAIAQGMHAHQIFAYAPRLPQLYTVNGSIKTPADLKGKRLSAAGGGVGGLAWKMGRVMLQQAGLTIDDASFISQGTAGRLPGLLADQVDAVLIHPEDVYIAQQRKPDVHVLGVMADILPNQMSGAYGASDEFAAGNRDLLVDVTAAIIEANRAIYRQRDTVLPVMVEATGKPQDAVEHAWAEETKNCVWAVNTGFDRARTEWMIENSLALGDIEKDKKPTFEQVVDTSIADEALAKLGGPVEIGGCKL